MERNMSLLPKKFPSCFFLKKIYSDHNNGNGAGTRNELDNNKKLRNESVQTYQAIHSLISSID